MEGSFGLVKKTVRLLSFDPAAHLLAPTCLALLAEDLER